MTAASDKGFLFPAHLNFQLFSEQLCAHYEILPAYGPVSDEGSSWAPASENWRGINHFSGYVHEISGGAKKDKKHGLQRQGSQGVFFWVHPVTQTIH